jgi:damage-control phosphatase, subfamily II, stand-alone protein
MPTLPLLADPTEYRPCIQDLLRDGDDILDYWLSLFERHIETLAALPVGRGRLDDVAAWTDFRADYLEGLAELRRRPDLRGELTVLELTRYRDERLAAFNLGDPFFDLKVRENEIALRQYPALVTALDAIPSEQRTLALAHGLFAGNMFDMGSKAAVDAFQADGGKFATALARVRPRPWGIDDFEAWTGHGRTYKQCLFFVDNAGPDIVLGVLPFVRELAKSGTRIVLAANSKPALNDITAGELIELLQRARVIDPVLEGLCAPTNSGSADAMFRVIASGCKSPLIDLRELTHECCAAAMNSDLLILEGMGRAIESNYDARFTIDTVKIALIKDPMVARIMNVGLFDSIFRYEVAR